MIQLTVNTKRQRFDGDPEMPLLWFLRDVLSSPAPSTAAAWGCAAPAPST